MSKPDADALFLKDYVRYDELTRTLEGWARDHPEFIHLSSLAKTEYGRDIWLLEVGKDPDRHRPAICIDGNMHSAELLGTNAALCIAQELVHLHCGQREVCDRWPRSIQESALEGLYYIIPCVTPDGAEEVLTAGRISRSAPRRHAHPNAPHWIRSDVDGDGRIRQIRMRHPAGEFVEHPDCPHVLVPRTVQDAGPFFKVFPEGNIEGFNGRNVPFAHTLSDNDSDFNRNFPYDWSSDHDGAGSFPGWEPETRALIEFGARSPHIFAWLNLHTFGGIFIRPPFSSSANEVDREDLLVYDYAATLAAQYTGMATVSAFEDMTPVASQPMTGTLAAWAYGERGCLAWAVELWDLFAAAGLQKRQPFFHSYAAQQRKEIAALAEWDARENGERVFSPWRAFVHPQLKDVEIGGIDPVRGFINPPEKEIAPISGGLASFAIALTCLGPRLKSYVTAEIISEKLTRIDLLATNDGYLPTYVSATSRSRPWNRGLQARFRTSGCTLVSGPPSADLGHLRGWGRGADEEANAPFFQKSQAIQDIGLTWVVQGTGQVEIEIGAPRVGWQTHKVAVDT
jgi:Zinc carboxypeptidase